MRAITIAIAATLLFSPHLNAELLRVELKTLRTDCDICARAITLAVHEVEGVRSVAVSLKDGLTILELREGNTVTLAQLRTLLKSNGLVLRDANVVARGSLVGDLFEVRFSRERLRVRGRLAKLERDRWTLVVPSQ